MERLQPPGTELTGLQWKELSEEQPGKIQSAAGNTMKGKGGKFVLEFANLTLFGTKAWSMLSCLEPESKPSGFAFVETHLHNGYSPKQRQEKA